MVALTTATGRPGTSGPLTSQSSAFFSAPGTPCAYSGLQITRASAVGDRAPPAGDRRRRGGPVAVEVGVEGRQVGQPVEAGDADVRRASAATASRTAPFDDTARRLPETRSICDPGRRRAARVGVAIGEPCRASGYTLGVDQVAILVTAPTGPGILHQLTGVIARHRGDITSVEILSDWEGLSRTYLEIAADRRRIRWSPSCGR